jgi:hypothetical protein
MTLAFRMDDPYKCIIEFPLEADRLFLVLNFMLLGGDGRKFYVRKMFEVVKDKKLKCILYEKNELGEKAAPLEPDPVELI